MRVKKQLVGYVCVGALSQVNVGGRCCSYSVVQAAVLGAGRNFVP